jgi:hypothetical protein
VFLKTCEDLQKSSFEVDVQVIDLNGESVRSESFALKRRKLAVQLARKMTKAIAARCWFEEIAEHLGTDSAAAIQRFVEPSLDEARASVAARRWRDYRAGNHFPCEAVTERVENFCSSANAVLRSPLWDALRIDRDPRKVATRLLGCTSKLGDELLSSALNQFKCRGNHPDWISKRCRDLILQGSLEGMATLLICMKLAAQSDDCCGRLTAGFFASATTSLIVLSRWICDRGVEQLMVFLYQKILLPEYCENYLGSRTAISAALPRLIGDVIAMNYQGYVRRPGAKIQRAEAIKILGHIERSHISWY